MIVGVVLLDGCTSLTSMTFDWSSDLGTPPLSTCSGICIK